MWGILWEDKICFSKCPSFTFPTENDKFILDTDASLTGQGGVLSQVIDGKEKVIGYFSKCFTKTERRYCVTRRELLAIVNSIKFFHHYLLGRNFLVRSDHSSLKWLLNFKNVEGQLARWLTFLSGYDFSIGHRAGKLHSNADALSRRPCLENDCKYCTRVENSNQEDEVRISHVKTIPYKGSKSWSTNQNYCMIISLLTLLIMSFNQNSTFYIMFVMLLIFLSDHKNEFLEKMFLYFLESGRDLVFRHHRNYSVTNNVPPDVCSTNKGDNKVLIFSKHDRIISLALIATFLVFHHNLLLLSFLITTVKPLLTTTPKIRPTRY